MIAIRLYQKKEKVRPDGKAPIYYVLAEGSKRKYLASRKYVGIDFFDNKSGKVLKGEQSSTKLNAFFIHELARLDSIINDLSISGREITFERVEKLFKNEFDKDFISFAEAELKAQKGLIKFKTWQGYDQCIRNLKSYCSELPFNRIDNEWLTLYKRHLVFVKGRKPNGYYQDFATIKKFWRIAMARGEVKTNPFENFKLEKAETVKNWLTKEELAKLAQLLEKDSISEAVKNTLRHFLFSCFTGIRFGDKVTFSVTNVINERIQLKTSKTQKFIQIPFSDQAQKLLDPILSRPLKQSNSRVNSELEICMNKAEIQKHITFHCSRHTFAITCIQSGIDIITVRDWLGHKSVTTTEIYAKIASQFSDQNMKKFDSYYNS